MLPDADRFNRGSLSRPELIARISLTSAAGVIIVSLHKGNPGVIEFLDRTGTTVLEALLESAMLRREVQPVRAVRVSKIRGIYVAQGGTKQVTQLAEVLSHLTAAPIIPDVQYRDPSDNAKECDVWLEEQPNGKILWTWYQSKDGTEIGPRIRVASVRSGTGD
jgi:rRNA maturation protein Rpf1